MFDHLFAHWPKPALVFSSAFLVVLVAIANYLSGPEFAFSIFYLPPIVVATWYVGKRAGIGIAFLSALVWITTEILTGHIYENPLAPYWNTGVWLAFFLITVFLAELRKLLHFLEALAFQDALTDAANSRKVYLVAECDMSHPELCSKRVKFGG